MRIAPSSSSRETSIENETAPPSLCPSFFPPHRKVRKRTRSETFSPYWILSASGEKFVIPKKLIVRDHSQSFGYSEAVTSNFLVDDIINPALILVLEVKSTCGFRRCAWYKPHETAKNRIVRMNMLEIERLLSEMESNEVLCESSLCNEFIDSSLNCFQQTSNNKNNLVRLVMEACKSALFQFRKHREMHCTLNGVFKLPEESTLTFGSCQICMDDEERRLYPSTCCKGSGAMCKDCLVEMKHLCPICDREFLNSYYNCAGCHKDLPFRDFGFPCVGCDKCILCEDCYNDMDNCTNCAQSAKKRKS